MADKANLINTVYKIGGIDSSKPLPVGVTLSIDPDLKKTLIYTGAAVGVGIGIGYFIASSLATKRKRRTTR